MRLLGKIFGRRPQGTEIEWQTPIVQEICLAMIRQIPDDWNNAALVLRPTEHGLGSGLFHSAISRQHPDHDFTLQDEHFVTPNLEVMAGTRKLELAWLQRKVTFRKAILRVFREGEKWIVESEYEY